MAIWKEVNNFRFLRSNDASRYNNWRQQIWEIMSYEEKEKLGLNYGLDVKLKDWYHHPINAISLDFLIKFCYDNGILITPVIDDINNQIELFINRELAERIKKVIMSPKGEDYWKAQIVDIMTPEDRTNFACETRMISRRGKEDEYFSSSDASLDDLITFCSRRKIPIKAITNEINEQKQKECEENGMHAEKFKEVLKFVKEFTPSQNYDFELPYHAELIGWLRSKFPEAIAEKQIGSSRPDIVIDGIAIEVKGPTTDLDLQTIADKCLRYSQHFKQGIIIVLFKVSVTSQRYNEWLDGMMNTHPHTIVIKK